MQYGFCNERQSSLGSNQQVLENIDSSIKIKKRVQRVSGRILSLVFLAHPIAQIGIAFQLLLQLQNAASQSRFARVKFRVRVGV